jgi:hypothetical protein
MQVQVLVQVEVEVEVQMSWSVGASQLATGTREQRVLSDGSDDGLTS